MAHREALILLLIFAAFLLFLMGLYIAVREQIVYRGRIRSRIQTPKTAEGIASEAELSDIRLSRSLSADGRYATPFISLNKLILQSGASWGMPGVLAFAAASCCAALFATFAAGGSFLMSIPVSLGFGAGVPYAVLRAMRDGRQRKFEEQLPEAIDTVVRGLKAGHAVPVTISSVGRNMPDPVGAEFRLTAAEMTFGLDLETAMANLHARVGQADLGLLALAVSIQSKTGGNLAEVLGNLSKVIRERFKLRRKAMALSAEGRFSAIVLTAIPVALFIGIWFLSPQYYGEVWDGPYTKLTLVLALLWMALGNYVMYRMVRIRV
jgi:tight adherence protein B